MKKSLYILEENKNVLMELRWHKRRMVGRKMKDLFQGVIIFPDSRNCLLRSKDE